MTNECAACGREGLVATQVGGKWRILCQCGIETLLYGTEEDAHAEWELGIEVRAARNALNDAECALKNFRMRKGYK